jgi:hypothetical protein
VCSDGNACTQTDTCQLGVCVGANPVVCTALDQCHVAGVCNPTSGVCTQPNAVNGTSCNDLDECTVNDTCQNGTCTGQMTECKVTGGGQINVMNPSGTANFGFNVQTDPQTHTIKGQLEYNNQSTKPPATYHSVSIDTLVINSIDHCTANPMLAGKRATFTGTIKRKSDGTTHPFTVRVEDCGEPGRNDYFSINIMGGDNQAGPLIRGNIQIHSSPQSGTSVTGAGGGVYPPGTLLSGVSLEGLQFGKGLTIASVGSSQGQFQATLIGTSLTGVKRYIQVEGKPTTGSLSGVNSATFGGTCLVDMGDGTPPLTNVPFTVSIVTNPDGTGSLALVLGTASLPAATVTEGYMTIK